MNKIFKRTSEYHFLKAILNLFFPDKEVDFIYMDGIGNLFNETNVNQMLQSQIDGNQVLVLADADTKAKGYGYKKRKEEIDSGMLIHGVSFSCFIYPDNQSDGDIETLMEFAARRDLHPVFFDCFEQAIYNVPNLKGKLHTYMSAQKLSGRLRNRLGSGDWLFDNRNYWNLDVVALRPLKDFLTENLK